MTTISKDNPPPSPLSLEMSFDIICQFLKKVIFQRNNEDHQCSEIFYIKKIELIETVLNLPFVLRKIIPYFKNIKPSYNFSPF